MKRTVILLLVLVILCAYWFVSRTGSFNSDGEITERDFAVKDLSTIKTIKFGQAGDDYQSFVRKGDEWYIKDSLKVRANAVDNLLEVLGNISLDHIPAASATKNILQEMRDIGIDVQLFDSNHTLLRRYTIGGSTQDERGTYVMMADHVQPYVVNLPHLEGSIRGRFVMDENNWRDRTVLAENIDQLQSIEVQYPKQLVESFVIDVQRQEVASSQLGKTESDRQVKSRIGAYLQGYENVTAEYIDNGNPNRSIIVNRAPFCTIRLKYVNQSIRTLSFYPYNDIVDGSADILTLEESDKVVRYFVDDSRGDLFLVQHRLVAKLMRGYSYFVGENKLDL